jgi:hypothetical protein
MRIICATFHCEGKFPCPFHYKNTFLLIATQYSSALFGIQVTNMSEKGNSKLVKVEVTVQVASVLQSGVS